MHYFGTDGIRGIVNGPLLNAGFLHRLAWALRVYAAQKGLQQKFVIGRDTRESGISFTQALADGLFTDQAEIIDLGIAPTPAIALCTHKLGATFGIAITASHNPASDNGIKLFDKKGLKLREEDERALEALIDKAPQKADQPSSKTQLKTFGADEAYISFIKTLIPKNSLFGLKIVLDTAHGATFLTSPAVLKYAGATLILIGNTPNGSNINQGLGSEHPEALIKTVLKHGADLGLAHDGDGDRLLCVDASGKLIPGEIILGALAQAAFKEGPSKTHTLVTTIQSNLGLDRAIIKAGGKILRTAVGDRHVLHALLNTEGKLGGENSGHFIFPNIIPCGDGLIAALELLKYLQKTGQKLGDLPQQIPLYPQKTLNVPVSHKPSLESLGQLQTLKTKIETELGTTGRLLIRYSGTENKLRLLVEGPDEKKLDYALQALENCISETLK